MARLRYHLSLLLSICLKSCKGVTLGKCLKLERRHLLLLTTTSEGTIIVISRDAISEWATDLTAFPFSIIGPISGTHTEVSHLPNCHSKRLAHLPHGIHLLPRFSQKLNLCLYEKNMDYTKMRGNSREHRICSISFGINAW
jgi:hypothetical protein